MKTRMRFYRKEWKQVVFACSCFVAAVGFGVIGNWAYSAIMSVIAGINFWLIEDVYKHWQD